MKTTVLFSLLSLSLLSSCGKKETAAVVEAPSASLDSWFTATPPSDPQPIHLVRKTAKPGDKVTISGRVMGRLHPFVEGRAAFILGDPEKLTPCNERPDDPCATPWDTCCDSAEDKRLGTAAIQIVDSGGRVLGQSIKGSHGLKELSTVTLTGTVDKASTPEALIINATQLHVVN